jgi:HD-like signal output (HDOD) protein
VARLLGLANSAYFGQSREIKDLQTAIYNVLGLDLVKGLTLGIVLNVQLNTSKCRAFNSEYFWMRSLLTAIAAQKLSAGNKLKDFPSSTVYTSGLLLYSGMLILGYLVPEELNEFLQRCEKNRTLVGREIKLQLGKSHFHLGQILLQKWQLPTVYQSVLNHFEDDEFTGEERVLINVLVISQRLSSMLLDDDNVDLAQLLKLGEKLELSTADLPAIVDKLLEDREKFQKLAAIIGN